MMMVFIPFILTAIFQRQKETSVFKHRIIVTLLGFVLLVNSAEGLDRASSKIHMKEAGEWVLEQSGGYQKSRRTYSNNRIVDYYVGKPVVEPSNHYSANTVYSLVLTTRWRLLTFLVIAVEGDSKPGFYRNFRFRIGKEPDKIFENRKGNKVFIYDFRLSRDYENKTKKKKPNQSQ